MKVLKENIQDRFEFSYDICYECKDYGKETCCHLIFVNFEPYHIKAMSLFPLCESAAYQGIPYDCDSIMNFGTETFSLGKPTMESVDPDCDLK